MDRDLWQYGAAILTAAISLAASGHAVLKKRDARAALAWAAFVWLAPLVGALAYTVLGVNRIRRRAAALHLPEVRSRAAEHSEAPLRADLPAPMRHLRPLVRLADSLVRRPLVAGTRRGSSPAAQSRTPRCARRALGDALHVHLRPGRRGGTRSWRRSVRRTGKESGFASSSTRSGRGTGGRARTSRSAGRGADGALPRAARASVAAVREPAQPPQDPCRRRAVGFAGGMNLRDEFMPGPSRPEADDDLQARLEGPMVAHLQSIFAEDWSFTTGEQLEGDDFFPPLAAAGPALARGISDGPDEDFECLRWVLLGAIAAVSARRHPVLPARGAARHGAEPRGAPAGRGGGRGARARPDRPCAPADARRGRRPPAAGEAPRRGRAAAFAVPPRSSLPHGSCSV